MPEQKTYILTRDQITAIARHAAAEAVNMALCELMPDTSDPVAMMPDSSTPDDLDRPRRLSPRQRELLAAFNSL